MVLFNEQISEDNKLLGEDSKSAHTSFITDFKRELNEKVAKEFRGKNFLDAFAGIGITTSLYCKEANSVIAIEKDQDNFIALKNNLRNFHNVNFFSGNNLRTLKYLRNYNYKFDVIDLDPFDNCFEQIKICKSLIDNGILMITSGEHYGAIRRYGRKYIVEDMTLKNRYGMEESARDSKGISLLSIKFNDIPLKVLFPFVEKIFKPKKLVLEYYYITKTSSRMIISIDYKISEDLKKFFDNNQNSFGWISRFMVKNEGLDKFVIS